MILVLVDGLDAEGLSRTEHAVRRAGVDPRRLMAEGGRVAIEATGLTRDHVAGIPGVAFTLEGQRAYPRIAKGAPEEVTRVVTVRGVPVGGRAPVLIAGPCAVEHEQQLEESARAAAQAGARLLRGERSSRGRAPTASRGSATTGSACCARRPTATTSPS